MYAIIFFKLLFIIFVVIMVKQKIYKNVDCEVCYLIFSYYHDDIKK